MLNQFPLVSLNIAPSTLGKNCRDNNARGLADWLTVQQQRIAYFHCRFHYQCWQNQKSLMSAYVSNFALVWTPPHTPVSSQVINLANSFIIQCNAFKKLPLIDFSTELVAMSFRRPAGRSIPTNPMYYPNRSSLDWVDEKYQLLGHLFVDDIKKIKGALNVMRNENRVLRKRVENLEQTRNFDLANPLELPCTEEVENRQHKTSQPDRPDKTLAPTRLHSMVLRSHKASKW